MMDNNVLTAWISIFLGLLMGATIGLFFDRETWLGGYGSWRRRMLRLAHISFFGTAFLNLSFAATVNMIQPELSLSVASICLIGGAFAMPVVCLLSAWRKRFRHLFFIPVLCLVMGTAVTLFRGIL